MSETKSPKHICIIQLTRIGDVLQTYQACLTVRNDYPETKLTLVARKQFAAPLKFLLDDVFHSIIYIDEEKILGDHSSLADSIEQLKKLTSEINAVGVDVIVNLSFSKVSAYLSSLINSKFKLGMCCNQNAEITISDKWSQYVYSTVMTGPLNPFSLVDIFRSIVGANQSVQKAKKKKTNNLITIHPFASLRKKTWKMDKWGEIIFKLLKNDPTLKINIVGAKNEKDEGHKLMENPLLSSQRHRINNFVGKTSIKELYKLVENSTLFVGHDSMVGHLASIANTQTLTISLGTVRPIESTPYGSDNYVISPKTNCYPCFPGDKCPDLKCHSDIPYQVVLETIGQLVTQTKVDPKKLNDRVTCFHLDGALIQQTSISNAGFLQLNNVTEARNSTRELMHTFYRMNWLFSFTEREEAIDFPELSQGSIDKLLSYLKGIEHIYELTSFGKKYSQYILSELTKDSPNLDDIKEFSTKIDEVDNLMDVVKQNYQALEPLINFYRIARFNIAGENVVELTEGSYLLYEEQAASCGVIFELIEKSITEYKYSVDRPNNQTERC
ncbi:MAG: glycosyltransferase family 9 protein [Bacteriovoracaceae bacterium]|nr:glycosyltransferase family 9 protein [Bacteriovoracaceae bacterium]